MICHYAIVYIVVCLTLHPALLRSKEHELSFYHAVYTQLPLIFVTFNICTTYKLWDSVKSAGSGTDCAAVYSQ